MKRIKADTAEAAVKAALHAANGLPKPPAHVRLRPEDEPFWNGIVRAKTREEWVPCDLVVAGQLARCQRDIEVESLILEGEGTIVRNDRGTQICNPRVMVLEQLARREMALMRSLRMGGKAVGDPRLEQAGRKLQRRADNLQEEIENEDVLA